MATVTLDYNARNIQARKALEYIQSLGLFRVHTNGVVQKETRSAKQQRIDKIFDPYLIDLSGFKFNRDEANNYD
ncbi:MAG: hypothetical protein LBR50_00085 [Tannerella sp.]|jgi:hypothetical protein|nr:hypothetical protein [Tannerella sp.]